MSDRAREFLNRAISAEDRAEELEVKLADTRQRLKAALGADPATAVSALGWMSRCERAEALLTEALTALDRHPEVAHAFPDAWRARAAGQIKAAEIAARDDHEMMRRPDDDEFWSTFTDESGARQFLRTRSARRRPKP